MKRPKRWVSGWNYVETEIAPDDFWYEGEPVASVLGYMWFNARDCRSLAVWLLKAADWLESKED